MVNKEETTNLTNPDDTPTVAAVIITRDRIDMLRQTLESLKASTYPLTEVIVTDDGTTDATERMLAAEFPSVILTKGPRRGISANRNHGISIVKSEYVLLLDDDLLVDPGFVETSLREAKASPDSLFFPTILENGTPMLPNGLDFLGFATRPYAPGAPYHTANCQCLIARTELFARERWDESISAYGYEEMDYGYRVAAAGFPIVPVPECVCVHLAPNIDQPFRTVQDASRLYVTFKRNAYIDKRPLSALLFACIALPHHLLAMVRRYGVKGIRTAFTNFRLAWQMLRSFRRTRSIAHAN